MKKRRNNKRSLALSILSMLLCAAMLVGSTMAWFTDNASTSVNKIEAGTLKIDIHDENGDSLKNQELSFVKADGTAITDEIKWEPGAKFKLQDGTIVNEGNLYAKCLVTLSAVNGNTEANGFNLADVIEVFINGDSQGTLSTLIAAGTAMGNEFVLAPAGQTGDSASYGTIELMMQTTAGNDYQGLSLTSVAIHVQAIQATVESDSYGNTYDAAATFAVLSKDITEFQNAVNDIEDGGTILLTAPVTVTGKTDGDMSYTGKTITLDFNETTATGANGNIAFRARGNSTANYTNGTIIADENTFSTISAWGSDDGSDTAVANVSNMTLYNSRGNGNSLKAFDNGIINVANTTVYSTLGGGAEAAGGTINITNCTFDQKEDFGDSCSVNVAASNGGTANIYSGTFTSENYGLYAFRSGGTINVYGGTFNAKVVLMADSYTTEPAGIFNIYGGSFNGLIQISDGSKLTIEKGTFANTGLTLEQFEEYVASGSTVTEANGVYTVG